jgi:hypothetical protein
MGIDVAGVFKAIAPTLVSILAGPAAGLAYELLGKAMGTTAEEAQKVVSSGQMTGEQLAAVKVAEAEAKAKETEFGFKFAELEIRDRESARAMQVATKSWTPEILSWFIVASTIGLEGYVMLYGVPAEAIDLIVGRVLGTLDAAFVTVTAYWLGTSSSSHAKDITIANATGGRRGAGAQ